MLKCGEESYKIIIISDNTYLSDDYILNIKQMENKGLRVISSDAVGDIDINLLKSADPFRTSIESGDDKSDHKNLMTLKKKSGSDILVYIFNKSVNPGYYQLACYEEKYCYMYNAFEDNYICMFPLDGKINFGIKAYEAIILVFTNSEINSAYDYTLSVNLTRESYEYETNPEWNYIPPSGCICDIKTWDISLSGIIYEQKVIAQPFSLIRDISGTELNHIKNYNLRPYTDTAKEVQSIYPLSVEYTAEFNIPEEIINKDRKLKILIENDTLQGNCRIFINEAELSRNAFIRETVYDYFNFVADADKFLKPGKNTIKINWSSASEYDGLKSAIYII